MIFFQIYYYNQFTLAAAIENDSGELNDKLANNGEVEFEQKNEKRPKSSPNSRSRSVKNKCKWRHKRD